MILPEPGLEFSFVSPERGESRTRAEEKMDQRLPSLAFVPGKHRPNQVLSMSKAREHDGGDMR